jgi:hypothetical protein
MWTRSWGAATPSVMAMPRLRRDGWGRVKSMPMGFRGNSHTLKGQRGDGLRDEPTPFTQDMEPRGAMWIEVERILGDLVCLKTPALGCGWRLRIERAAAGSQDPMRRRRFAKSGKEARRRGRGDPWPDGYPQFRTRRAWQWRQKKDGPALGARPLIVRLDDRAKGVQTGFLAVSSKRTIMPSTVWPSASAR